MKMRMIAVIYTVLMVVILKYVLNSFGQNDFERRDMIYYNDIIKQVYEAYKKGEDINSIEQEWGCDIVLYGDADYMASTYKYYGSYGLVMDFAPAESDSNDSVIGKICFVTEENAFTDAEDQVRHNSVMIWCVILAAGYILMIILYFNYIRPFRELQHFTTEIAKGNLDVVLPVHRENMFGAFTESFDVMREELAASRKREAEAEKSKKELVAQLSHDIKTPVATIKATCEVLEMKERLKLQKLEGEGVRDEEAEINGVMEKLGYISDKADTIDQLISNMFHAALEELEVLDVKPVETDSRILNDIFAGMSQMGNIIVDNPVPECLVYMDKLRMEQVIGNVVQNSLKYAGTDVRILFDMVDFEGNQFLRIMIRDYGPGIPEEELYRVTEKFYRGSNASGKQGSGLGLYLARFFMEKQMGGFECYNQGSDHHEGFVVELLLRKV